MGLFSTLTSAIVKTASLPITFIEEGPEKAVDDVVDVALTPIKAVKDIINHEID